MNRRTLDIVLPILYVIAIMIGVFSKNETAVGKIAVIGALLLAIYFAALRRNLPAGK